MHGTLANPADSPYRSGMLIDRIPHDGLPPEDKPRLLATYQSIVGGLNWLSLSTRPDITPVTRLLASHLKNPSQGHLDAARHVLRYLKGSPEWGNRFTQPLTDNPPDDAYDPDLCASGMVSWPTDSTPRVSIHN